MSTRLFGRYMPLGGSARRYLDRETGLTISRRAFLKLCGIIPEQRALARRAAGLIPRRKRRGDAGIVHPVLLWTEARTVPYAGRFAQVVPYQVRHPVRVTALVAQRFAVFIDHVCVTDVHLYRHPGKRCSVWHCPCTVLLLNKESLVAHVATHHLQGFGAAAIPYPGEVHPNERRSRMPWRVTAE